MTAHKSFILLDQFPDVNELGFDCETYFATFKNKNVIINATASDIVFNKHWGPLSIKCTIRGKEYYQVDRRSYAVEPSCFLVLNEGTCYSSCIQSEESVESFTLHFSESFVQQLIQLNINSINEDFGFCINNSERVVSFTEKINRITPQFKQSLFVLYKVVKKRNDNQSSLEESCHEILTQIMLHEKLISYEIFKINAIKHSTRKELFKRLYYAKDYIDSCFCEDVQLNTLSGIVFMNEAYFLRQFKHFFKVTPKQYLIRKRLDVAEKLLRNRKKTITEICNEVGYADLSSFGKLFKLHYKCTPEEYRSGIN